MQLLLSLVLLTISALIAGYLGMLVGALFGWFVSRAADPSASDSWILGERRYAAIILVGIYLNLSLSMPDGTAAGLLGVLFSSIYLGFVSRYHKKGFVPTYRIFFPSFYFMVRKDER